MTPRTEPRGGALVAELAGDEAGPRARRHGLVTRREWLMIGAAALCFGGAFTALLFGIG